MRKELLDLAVELVAIETQLAPIQKRRDEIRSQLKAKYPVGKPEVVEGFEFTAYEKQKINVEKDKLLTYLGDRASLVTTPTFDAEKLDAALKLGHIKSEELEPFVSVSVDKVFMCRKTNGHAKEGA